MAARGLIAFMLTFTGVVLVGCATESITFKGGHTTGSAVSYDKVISGAFGFNFGIINTNALKDKGFEEGTLPRYYSDVGTWKKRKHEFFNFGIELVVSPYSNLLKSIEGLRFYGSRKYVNHFATCMDDYRAIITQLKNKYPTLVSGPSILSQFKLGEYASSSYFEGVAQRQYSKEHLGRWVSVRCSIQTWRDAKVIGSLLDVSYHEERKITGLIDEEQKRVFKSKSRQRLEKKGLSTDQL